MKDRINKLGNEISKNVNKVLENVDCEYRDKKLIFTVKQIQKYNERVIKAVLKAVKGYL